MKAKNSLWKRICRWFSGVYHVYCHEFSLVAHDPGLVLFFTFLPLAYPIIYSLIYNPEVVTEVPVVVIDDDRTPLSRELTRNLDACPQMHVIGYAAELGEAKDAMSSGHCFGIIHIPSGFEQKVGRQESSPVVMYSDMSLLLRYRGFLVATTEVMQAMGAEIMQEDINRIAPLATTIANGDLLPIHNEPLGNIRSGFDSFIMPGVLMLILQQCLVLAAGMAGAAKRENYKLNQFAVNMLDRSTMVTMVGQAAVYCTIAWPAAIFLFHYVPLIFRFPVMGNPFEEMLFLLPFCLASIGLGYCLQGATLERESVFLNWVITSLAFLFLSGLIWPRYAMLPFWKALSSICPATWGVEGFIKMNGNGATLGDVGHDYIALWICAVGWWALAWVIQRFGVRPAIFHDLALRRSITQAINNPQPVADSDIQNEIPRQD